MGLSVVHGIVNAHGGIITVESEPGQGTTFRVCFPVIQCEQTDQKPTVSAPLPTGTERILLVDDEESLAGVLTTRLELQGYHVTCKSDGIDALAAF